MVLYLRAMAGAAETIAEGDLRYDVTPMSDKDALGNSFKEDDSVAPQGRGANSRAARCRSLRHQAR